MGVFVTGKIEKLFSQEGLEAIRAAVREAEGKTSGELRTRRAEDGHLRQIRFARSRRRLPGGAA
ncbi:MAG: hypothetical protein V3R89_09345, partial [Thermoanaerobaculia bacterium]